MQSSYKNNSMNYNKLLDWTILHIIQALDTYTSVIV